MSFFGTAKEFFGFGPYDDAEDAYYDDQQYREQASAQRTPRSERAERVERPERVSREPIARSFTPEIITTTPRSYNDAKDIGEPFRDGDAVIMDLTDLEAADAKRVVDFAAGLCFALRGLSLIHI